MLKALFKKQLLEVNTWLFVDRKTGKNRSAVSVIMFALLYAVLFLMFGGMFFGMACSLCGPLVSAGMAWFYFAIMGIISVFIAVLGSVFTTYSSLYAAKDNDLLLSLPIKPSLILAVRLSGVWMWGFIYEFLGFFPAILVYQIFAGFSITALIFGVIVMLFMSFFVLTVTCVLGWIVANISAKLKAKSFIVVLISLVFMGTYYFASTKLFEILRLIIVNAEAVSEKVKGFAYLFYCLGRACEGNVLYLVIFIAVVSVLFLALYLVLSRSFLKLATANRSASRKKYSKKNLNRKSINKALLIKEFKRFLSSPTYMLNCGLGTVMMIVMGAAVIIKGASLREVISELSTLSNAMPALFCIGICLIAAMNDITAPSISLEGKNIWLIQSLPVSPRRVLGAKLALHLLLTQIPALFCSICVAAVLRLDLFFSVMIMVIPLLFALLSAEFGLVLNLKMPNLNWTNENIPVKQSAGVLLAMFGSWAFVAFCSAGCFGLSIIIGIRASLLICAAVIVLISALLMKWLTTRGAEIFSSL